MAEVEQDPTGPAGPLILEAHPIRGRLLVGWDDEHVLLWMQQLAAFCQDAQPFWTALDNLESALTAENTALGTQRFAEFLDVGVQLRRNVDRLSFIVESWLAGSGDLLGPGVSPEQYEQMTEQVVDVDAIVHAIITLLADGWETLQVEWPSSAAAIPFLGQLARYGPAVLEQLDQLTADKQQPQSEGLCRLRVAWEELKANVKDMSGTFGRMPVEVGESGDRNQASSTSGAGQRPDSPASGVGHSGGAVPDRMDGVSQAVNQWLLTCHDAADAVEPVDRALYQQLAEARIKALALELPTARARLEDLVSAFSVFLDGVIKAVEDPALESGLAHVSRTRARKALTEITRSGGILSGVNLIIERFADPVGQFGPVDENLAALGDAALDLLSRAADTLLERLDQLHRAEVASPALSVMTGAIREGNLDEIKRLRPMHPAALAIHRLEPMVLLIGQHHEQLITHPTGWIFGSLSVARRRKLGWRRRLSNLGHGRLRDPAFLQVQTSVFVGTDAVLDFTQVAMRELTRMDVELTVA